MRKSGEVSPSACPKMIETSTRVAGVTAKNKDGSRRQSIIRQCSVGEKLKFVREPHGLNDAIAVQVLLDSGEQIGYLDQDLADKIAAKLKSGQPVDGRIADVKVEGWFFNRKRDVDIVVKYWK